MAKVNHVCIGIQARSTSERFKNKVSEVINGKSVLERVVESCQRAARYINAHTTKNKTMVSVSVLIPTDDPIKDKYKGDFSIMEGPENDVLTRYKWFADRNNADYVVRITADCPMIQHPLLNKHIVSTIMNKYDYMQNVDPSVRTFADGLDVEVISKRTLDWLDEFATDPEDREHVTLKLWKSPPEWLIKGQNWGVCVGQIDNLNDFKLSLDTEDDLKIIKEKIENVERKVRLAKESYGPRHVHRF